MPQAGLCAIPGVRTLLSGNIITLQQILAVTDMAEIALCHESVQASLTSGAIMPRQILNLTLSYIVYLALREEDFRIFLNSIELPEQRTLATAHRSLDSARLGFRQA